MDSIQNTIILMNNVTGTNQRLQLDPGTTVGQLAELQSISLATQVIRVNGESPTPDQVLEHGDKVAVLPSQSKGA